MRCGVGPGGSLQRFGCAKWVVLRGAHNVTRHRMLGHKVVIGGICVLIRVGTALLEGIDARSGLGLVFAVLIKVGAENTWVELLTRIDFPEFAHLRVGR